MTPPSPPRTIPEIATEYATFCEEVAGRMARDAPEIERLISAMKEAGAIHCYGFGRSGSVASALAIRLRHFQHHLGASWFCGDLVRNTFHEKDLLIVISKKCTRSDLLYHVETARSRGVRCAFVTGEPPLPACIRMGDLVFSLPSMKHGTVYGGGDFELAASFFQEVLVTRIGERFGIGSDDIDLHHVP
ncbi:MAG TPA: hypothetical protein PK089_01270 [Methanoregulaceae archaeon]|nr:hypothetical protein [Methanoregulaceae archaeon]HOV66970.1 hypothetical protein [Methanoregulaceae archaeon]HQJ87409.1 hypothetical protein [Methanoregulaceae archaeon]